MGGSKKSKGSKSHSPKHETKAETSAPTHVSSPEDAKILQGTKMKQIGTQFLKSCEFTRALHAYRAAILFFPKDHEEVAILHSNAAACLLHISPPDYKAVVDECTKSIDIKATYPRAFARRAKALFALGKLAEARADVRSALQLEAGFKDALDVLKDIKEAEHVLKKKNKLNSKKFEKTDTVEASAHATLADKVHTKEEASASSGPSSPLSVGSCSSSDDSYPTESQQKMVEGHNDREGKDITVGEVKASAPSVETGVKVTEEVVTSHADQSSAGEVLTAPTEVSPAQGEVAIPAVAPLTKEVTVTSEQPALDVGGNVLAGQQDATEPAAAAGGEPPSVRAEDSITVAADKEKTQEPDTITTNIPEQGKTEAILVAEESKGEHKNAEEKQNNFIEKLKSILLCCSGE